MRKNLFVALILASSPVFANFSVEGIARETSYAVHTTPETKGGVSGTDYKFWKLSPEEMQKTPVKTIKDWVNVTSQSSDVSGAVNTAVKVTGYHQVCFTNSLPAALKASYKFTLSVMDKTTEVSNKMIVSGGSGTCITKKTYMSIRPAESGHHEIISNSVGKMGDFTANNQSNAALEIQ